MAAKYRTTFAAVVVASFAAFACAQGIITTIAGNEQFRFTGGSATNTPLGRLVGIAIDPHGNVYAADQENHTIVNGFTGICLKFRRRIYSEVAFVVTSSPRFWTSSANIASA